MVRVGLVGCGTIGTQLALAVQRTYRRTARITALHDVEITHARTLQQRLVSHPPLTTLPQLLQRSDLVLEAASATIAGRVAAQALSAHRDVLIMSTGGLLMDRTWRRALARSRGRLYVPSGALAGVDGIKALAVGRIRRLSLTTSKPPAALMGAPFARRRGLRLSRLLRPTVIFNGSPSQVVKAFPQNTNIAATLAIAAASSATPRIRVVADPSLRVNRHELTIEADSGTIHCRIESRPSANPKTSELAVRSAVATLGRIFGQLQIGT